MTAAVWGTRVIGAVVLLSLGACGKSADEGALERRALRQAASMGPDFIIKSVTGPTSVTPGQQFIASVTVCNQGTQADSTDVELYFSSDATITPTTTPGPTTDQPLGRMPTSFLNAGQCQTLSMSANAWVPSEGAWYLGAAADPSNSRPELIEDNNTLAGTRMGVGSKADFIIKSVTGPASATPGQQFTASVTVCNQGTQGDSTDVELYFSSDTIITPTTTPGPTTDQPLGRMPTSFLNAGQCQTLSMSANAWVPTSGNWYLGAAADPGNYRPELIEDNNTLAGNTMSVKP